MSTYQAALAWAARGFRVFPCLPGQKEPAVSWVQRATTDPETIRLWFDNNQNYNIGYALGGGYICIDVDTKNGNDGLSKLMDLGIYGLKGTLVIRTPSGGYHLLFTHSDTSQSPIAKGLDVRTRGGYALAPGSLFAVRHADGSIIWPAEVPRYSPTDYSINSYEIICNDPIAPLPEVISKKLKPRGLVTSNGLPALVAENLTLNISEAIECLRHCSNVAIQGQHGDDTTYQLAARMTRDYALSEAMVFTLLTSELGDGRPSWNARCEPPWDLNELKVKIANGSRYGRAQSGSGTTIAVYANTIGAADISTVGPKHASDLQPHLAIAYQAQGLQPPEPQGPRRARYTMASEILPRGADELWPNKFYVGMAGIIAGMPGEGKSQLAIYMAAVVSRGLAWPDGSGKAKQGKVIILSAEDHPEITIVPRLLAAGADVEKVALLHGTKESDNSEKAFNLETDMAELSSMTEKLNAEGEPVRLVIIDPIAAYLSKDKNAELRSLWNTINSWAQKYNVCIVVIDHLNKDVSNSSAIGRFHGSIATVANSRSAFLVVPEDEEDATKGFAMVPVKNNLAELGSGWTYKIEKMRVNCACWFEPLKTSRIVWLKESETTKNNALKQKKERVTLIAQAMDWIRGELEKGPQYSQQMFERAAFAGHNKNAIERARERLRYEHQIVLTRDQFGGLGVWCLPQHNNPQFISAMQPLINTMEIKTDCPV